MTSSTHWSLSPMQNEPELFYYFFLMVVTLLQSYFLYEGKLIILFITGTRCALEPLLNGHIVQHYSHLC